MRILFFHPLSARQFNNNKLIIYLSIAQAATITLFGVMAATEYPTPSETFKALGVGEDGATTYLNKIVVSEVLEGHLNGGTTYTSAGKTVTERPPFSTVTQAPQTYESKLSPSSRLKQAIKSSPLQEPLLPTRRTTYMSAPPTHPTH